MRESGLKSISILDSVGDNVVFLHAREWIEIKDFSLNLPLFCVFLHAREWIEIPPNNIF